MGKMKNIKLSIRPVLADIFRRQTPGSSGVWGDCRFHINTPVEKCDWWVVCHNSALVEAETTFCDPNHIVYVSLEPEDSWLSDEFISQFSQLLLCDRAINHPKIIYKNGLNWFVGIHVGFKLDGSHQFTPSFTLDYDSLSSMQPLDKSKFMSVICSNKSMFPGHTIRKNFIEKLKAHPISKQIDFFGGGNCHVDDKWDAIAPYKYHLVLENSVVPDYWSEKLADSFLGYSYPLYYGCPNIHNYFDRDSLCKIDVNNFKQTLTTIEKLLSSDTYQLSLPAVIKARHQVLNCYNLFQILDEICSTPAKSHTLCKLSPRDAFQKPVTKSSIFRRIIRKAFKLIHLGE